MAEEAGNSETPIVYRAIQTFAIDKIDEKFRSGATVLSSRFFCRHDPQPAIFELSIRFDREQGEFSPNVTPIDRNVTARYLGFTLYDDEGELLEELQSNSVEVFLKDFQRGFPNFYQSSGARRGTWKLVCHVDYEASAPVEEKDNPDADESVSSSSLQVQKDFLELLESSKNADVTFSVKGEEIRAHRTILIARSSYFANMFGSDMEESRSNEVKVPDTEPKVFRGMLEFLYSGLPPKNLSDIAMDLLSVADKYGINELMDLCESSITSNLTAANVVDVLLLADQLHCEDLLYSAMTSFRVFYSVLKESEEATDKLETSPKLLLKLIELFSRE